MHIIKGYGSTFRWSRFRNDVAGGCLMIPALHDRPLREESSSVFSFEGDKITPQQTVKECAAPSVQIKLPRGSRISWETSEEEGHFFFTLLYDFIIIYLHWLLGLKWSTGWRSSRLKRPIQLVCILLEPLKSISRGGIVAATPRRKCQ